MDAPKKQVPFYKTVEGVIIPGAFHEDCFREGLNYKAKTGDVFVASFPKCGTTWTQMIVYLIRSQGEPAPTAQEFTKMVPFLDMTGLEMVENGHKPFGIKTHLPFDRTPYSEEAKYIYVTRNPKDVVVSYYHHAHTVGYLFDEGEFDDLFDMFMEGKTEYGDFFEHVLGWYEHRHDSNVLFLTYEDLKRNTRETVLKIARFIDSKYGEMLETEPNVMEKVLKHCNLAEMKKLFDASKERSLDKSMTAEIIDEMPLAFGVKHFRKFALAHRKDSSKNSNFIREGAVGKWKDVLTAVQTERIDKELHSKLSGTDLLELWNNI